MRILPIHRMNQLLTDEILRYCAITILCVIVLQFLKVVKENKNAWYVIAFGLSIVCYLLLESRRELNSIPLKLLLVGPFLLPLFFWFLSKSIFDDHFEMKTSFIVLVPVVLMAHYLSFYTYVTQVSAPVKTLAMFIPKTFSFGFMALGVWEALRNKKLDLIDARLRFRNIFIIVTASVIAATLIVESLNIWSATPEILPVIQKSVIILISLYFLQNNMYLNFRFFLRPVEKEKTATTVDLLTPVVSKISKLMTQEKAWRREGLTIGALADLLAEQEYRVRRAINGRMGFRNFSDFLNHYRVQEACAILRDPSKRDLTVLEIAYSLGYQSIGPFNKAFKEETGLTPTEFRRKNLC